MSILLKINTVDKSNNIVWESLSITQNLTSQVDTATFKYRKYGSRTLSINYSDVVEIWDGATQIFGGNVQRITQETESNADGILYTIECADYTVLFDSKLVAQTYTSQTIHDIIDSICTLYAPDFDAVNVTSTYIVPKIVFNQVKPSDCLKKLADIVNFDWYIDENKSIHFFSKEENPAPFNLTDTSGNFISKTLNRKVDGSLTVNRVKVRGGEYDGSTYTDKITVSGNNTKSFSLPYKFSNLTVKLNAVTQTVGIDNIDDFTTKDVLYSFQEKSIRWNAVLADGDLIEFSGNPKIKVFAIAEDSASIALYGVREKLIREDDITDNTVARKRGIAELYAYANGVVDATFTTHTSGLRAGMNIRLTSTKRNCDDDLIIKSVTFQAIDANTFGYRVQCINGRIYGLIEILAKLLAPKTLNVDETEISEEIFADNGIVNIVEDHQVITAVQDFATVTISDNYYLNPLGAGVDAIYVLGDYHPSSQTDTKRHGRLNYSMKLY